MKMQAKTQFTLRGVPQPVDSALRLKAKHRKQSLNQLILDELTRATVRRQPTADFSDLVGKWTPDAAFEQAVASQRQVDLEKWK
jgi:hypothetical protein